MVLCVLSGALLTGYALQCYQCFGPTCEEKNVTCQSNKTFCGTWVVRQVYAGLNMTYFLKDCAANKTLCDLTGDLNTGNIYQTEDAKCCSDDLCNAGHIPVRPIENASMNSCPCSDSCGVFLYNPDCINMTQNVCLNISFTILHGSYEGHAYYTKSCVANNNCIGVSSSISPAMIKLEQSESCCRAATCSSTVKPITSSQVTNLSSVIHPLSFTAASVITIMLTLAYIY